MFCMYRNLMAEKNQERKMKQLEQVVIIVGAGPSGLSAAACLTLKSIPYIILEREDCFASLWQKYSYDRLHLHLIKHFSKLPHMVFPATYPTYLPKNHFLQYINDYVSHFEIWPVYRRSVEDVNYDEGSKKWVIKAWNLNSGKVEEYCCRFLVVASGGSSDSYTPEVEGLSSFKGEVFHSTSYKNGKAYQDQKVLVVGSGNSGMEIALDLAEHGVETSIVIRSPINVVSRGMLNLGVVMGKVFPSSVGDRVLVTLSKIVYGDLSKYGIERPKHGPLYIRDHYAKFPVCDVGTCNKIKSGQIKVLPAIERIRGNEVGFENGKSHYFDTIVFCTGFKRSTRLWLKGDDCMLDEDGIAKQSYPNHWKGNNGLYCAGLSS